MIKKLLIVTGVSAIFIGLAYHIYTQVELIKQYCFNRGKVQIKKIGVNEISFVQNIELLNRSNITAEIIEYNFDISVNGRKVGKVKDNAKQFIASKKFSTIAVDVSFNPKQVLKGITFDVVKNILLENGSNIKFAINGNIKIRQGKLFNINLPINVSMTLKDIIEMKPDDSPCV